ncbi:heavy-metal-associated domain-containing protein [Seleniivibrio woodruffii]|uniref:Copper chaperone n=1 Tax=Seleniivibrio woodruffii TaxID=1078050 RepID=A0A4R1KGK3_9BACT|nr:copper ion binding protein [Seleniivibrio woodruffii]TCK62469.1 copper chaperone [Seleniivibrio woodruffii]TVZ37104.1 copper chaperone [Seleniivibrio woodruffii]
MKEKVFNVSGMKCKHCVMTVTEAVSEVEGVQSCDVSLEKGTVTVKFDDTVDESEISSAIKEEGFGVA